MFDFVQGRSEPGRELGFDNPSRLYAVRANPDPLCLPVLDATDLLQVRIPFCFGLVVSMTDIVPDCRAFAADFADS
jgi:hypothetical protein